MPRVRDVCLVLVGVVVLGATARADMMLVSPAGVAYQQSPSVRGPEEIRTVEPSSFLDYSNVLELDLGSIRFALGADGRFDQTSDTQRPRILTDGHSSLSLCLSALAGLGLCSSAHCLKKLRCGFIPEWYHRGGPAQIGHSLAVNPDSVCPVTICRLIQPTFTAEHHPLQYHRPGIIVSLWRKSQFTPDVIASRGPPVTC